MTASEGFLFLDAGISFRDLISRKESTSLASTFLTEGKVLVKFLKEFVVL